MNSKDTFLIPNILLRMEDDYMSSSFIEMAKSHTGPKLSIKKRKTPDIQKTLPLKEREQKAREEGLATEISEESKGLHLNI